MSKSLFATALVVSLSACSNATMGPSGGGGGTNNGGGSSGTGGNGGGGGGGSHVMEICNDGVDNNGNGLIDCADPDCFTNPACFATCQDLCTDGSSICDTAGVKQCRTDPMSGCKSFGAATACTNGLVCSGGSCVATCTNQCTLGAKTCSNTGGVVECQMLATGCTDWIGPTMCMNTEVCSGGACVMRGACTNQCTAGATQCTAGGQQQTCTQQATGCTDWSFPTACQMGNTCAAGATSCQPIPHCTQGQTRCAAASPAVETCDANSNWTQTQICAQACMAGACTANATCTAGAVRCNNNDVEICNSSGSAWLYHQSCNVGCNGGLCTDPCTAGATRCNGSTVETCNMAGTAWTAAASACPNGCYLGGCMDADLTVDGVTQTLEGDLSFKNDVVIKNGGSLKVGPSGQLKIHAQHITIDAASNINANDVGDSTQCPAVAPTCSCTYYCTQTASGTGGGACYGTDRAATSSQYITNNCCYGGYCYGSAPAASQYDRGDDLSISEGSVAGTVKGGGLVELFAQAVDVSGQITANATGTGASGGGILIATDTLTGAGAIQSSGGGSGGVGRVKLLRGASNMFSGSVTGTKADSPMPPLDLVSGSHPDSKRWYNDGLGDWYLAWSKPYATANGYYYKLSTSASTLPSQSNGNGTFYQQESYVVKAKDLVQGSNFFHIVSVDSAFNVGSVKATQSVQINTVPPTVASMSHPAQRTWYQNNALYFTWTNPQDDSNFTGYYYVLDQHADTVPTPSSTSFTTNKQVLLANTADGIWVFHIVNRDTRSAITKAAQHYVVYVGTEPMKENLSGSVFDASNNSAPLSGVTISINGGLFSTSSTSSGTYTFSGSLYVGHWEVTASKDGYTPQTKVIDLMAGMPLNENFTLMKTP
jgi:hypothetical protein